MSNPVKQAITQAISEQLQPTYLEIINESHMHSVPKNSETHFKCTVVSDAFDGLNLVKRHQAVYKSVAAWMQNPIHALALHTYTAPEWQAKSQSPASPTCRGGSGK